jgi:transposase
MLEHLRQQPWLYLPEMARFLKEEWEIEVHRSTIGRALKKAGISRKKGQRIGPRSEELRVAWQAFASQVKAEQLVFIDESQFKLQTMWRSMAYAPIGDPARYRGDMTRGDSISVLPAYTTAGYLPCTGIKKGYYNKEDIIDWLINRLLPLCNEYPGERSIIVLDNVSIHIDPRIIEAIQAKGCLVKYLPPYSPDYNPIELTFSVLKAWMRRHFEDFRHVFSNDFEGFLRHAIENSGCDRFAIEHFKHSTAGYIFDGEIEQFERDVEQWFQV